MQITIHPVAGLPGQVDDTVSINADRIAHNGVTFDLSSVPEGGEAIPQGDDHPFIGPITRKDGELHLGLRLVYDTRTARADQPTDPARWTISVYSGALPDPIARKEDEA